MRWIGFPIRLALFLLALPFMCISLGAMLGLDIVFFPRTSMRDTKVFLEIFSGGWNWVLSGPRKDDDE